MKHIIMILVALFMSMSTSAFAGTTTGNSAASIAKSITIPTNLIVKQTITFNDNQCITVYYQKQGNVCKLYSTSDVTKYKASDLNSVKATNFEIVNQVEGKCYITHNTSDVWAFARSVFNHLR